MAHWQLGPPVKDGHYWVRLYKKLNTHEPPSMCKVVYEGTHIELMGDGALHRSDLFKSDLFWSERIEMPPYEGVSTSFAG